jgi:hypothetical protein
MSGRLPWGIWNTPKPNSTPPPGQPGPACDGAGCQQPATHRWAQTNKRRAFKFCSHHSEQHLMGAGFEVRPEGWDR